MLLYFCRVLESEALIEIGIITEDESAVLYTRLSPEEFFDVEEKFERYW